MMMDQKSKTHKKQKLVVIGIILILVILYIILVNVLVSAALVPSFMKKLDAFEEITEKGYSKQVHTTDIQKNHKKIIDKTNKWLKTAKLEKWHQISADGYRLVAAYFPSDGSSGHKWAVILHGYTGWKEEMYPFAYQYHEWGYNVVVPDLRCQGESEGDFIGMGWTDRTDVLGWIRLIIKKDPDKEPEKYWQTVSEFISSSTDIK